MPKARAKRSIGAEKLHEAQTRAAYEKQFHDLLDAAPDAILEIDSGGRIARANAAAEELFGYSHSELLDQPVELLIPEEARRAHIRHRKAYSDSPTKRPMGSNLDLYARRKDGSRFSADIVLSPFHLENGDLSVAAIVRDVTERKHTESALKEARHLAESANSAKSDFLASMSHELRSPLNTIMGYTQLLAEESVGPLNEKQRRFLGHIAKDSHHLLNLINDILDLSKIESGRLELQRESCRLQPLFDDVLSMSQPQAAPKNVRIENHECPDAVVWGDPLRMKQVLLNLLSNAVKFTPSGGFITLSASQKEHQVAISVTDTGIGIAAEHHEAIFSRFHQVSSTTRGVREGTGLGLAITKSLVEQMGGEIWVESETGKGSRFTFTLDGHLSQSAGKEVLVIEDEPLATQLIVDYLQPEGYAVAVSNSVASALAALAARKPAAIILDLVMPGQPAEGLDLLKQLKASAETRDIPVIVVSVMEAERSPALRMGAAAHLSKPVHKHKLLEALRYALHTT